ncbi:MAG: DUF2207 domain-containing protein [Clostridiales bacterium]|nr:DUF2207 domain-containing protein [Clostridiales bacterium]
MKKRTFFICTVLLVLFLGLFVAGAMDSDTDTDAETEYDTGMETEDYQVSVVLSEDGSYQVTETISVNMLSPRHGIYRYLTVKGALSAYNEDGEVENLPYYVEVTDVKANVPLETYTEDNAFVMKLGDEDATVSGEMTYVLEYCFNPEFQSGDLEIPVYYNLFPSDWGNVIPVGSQFSFTFPETTGQVDVESAGGADPEEESAQGGTNPGDSDLAELYYGPYGSTADAGEILSLTWEGNTLTGVLTRELEPGNGLTLFSSSENGFITGVSVIFRWDGAVLAGSLCVLALILLLFFRFGRDEEIIPSVQFQPPEGLDSAAVGYIVDDEADSRDILSLILYWADKGYLTIEEKKKNQLWFHKTDRPLPKDAPKYERIFFNKIFEKGEDVSLKSLKYRLSDTITASSASLKAWMGEKGGLYVRSSRILRLLCAFLAVVPMAALAGLTTLYGSAEELQQIGLFLAVGILFAGILVLSRAADRRYFGRAGETGRLFAFGILLVAGAVTAFSVSSVILIQRGQAFAFWFCLAVVMGSSVPGAVVTAFMKKRTSICVQWTGKLAGLRDFIETAELDRMEALAEENPQWFWNVLPYAYVMGLSDVFARRMEGLAVPAPDWYICDDPAYRTWNVIYFNRVLMHNMETMKRTMTAVEPSKAGSGGHGGGGGGTSFGGGGGFSGGGFGGGGGRSW